jgi:hypothetical protein
VAHPGEHDALVQRTYMVHRLRVAHPILATQVQRVVRAITRPPPAQLEAIARAGLFRREEGLQVLQELLLVEAQTVLAQGVPVRAGERKDPGAVGARIHAQQFYPVVAHRAGAAYSFWPGQCLLEDPPGWWGGSPLSVQG